MSPAPPKRDKQRPPVDKYEYNPYTDPLRLYFAKCDMEMDQAKEDFDAKWDKLATGNSKLAKLDDFERFRTLGIGTFGRVLMVQHKGSKEFCAMKIREKEKVMRENSSERVIHERRILDCIRWPFVLGLKYHFKDNSNLYMCMELIQDGDDMSTYLQRFGKFPESIVGFYSAQMLLALEYVHHMGIIFRDLRPGNILIDKLGYIKLTGFTYAKRVIKNARTYTVCGTPRYLAPETLLGKGHTKVSDFWAFGIVVFEMITGYSPFAANHPVNIYEKIIAGHMTFPHNLSHLGRELLTRLIKKDPAKRLGSLKNGVNDIKRHLWYASIDWEALTERRYDASIILDAFGESSMSTGSDCTFTSAFTMADDLAIVISPTDKYKAEFDNF